MRWLSLYLPHLSLEVFATGDGAPSPLAISDGPLNRPLVHARNQAAAHAGITPGMTIGAAETLVPNLRVCPRSPTLEAQTLERLAAWAGQFTSQVALHPPQGILLEIAASLNLFGGLERLQQRIADSLNELGYRARYGTAPTPLGAWLLSRAGGGAARDLPGLTARLFALPLAVLELDPKRLERLTGLGLATLGDCLRLPRDGLARRLGPDLLDTLDRAFGRIPDPQPIYQPPETFRARLILPAPVEQTEALAFVARRLLLELCGFLRGRDLGVNALHFELRHPRHPPSHIPLGLVTPSRDPDHLLGLLREHFARTPLPAPAEELWLEATALQPWSTFSDDLFDPLTHDGDWAVLVEKLRARLGEQAVAGLEPHADHRPERAWRLCAPEQAHELPTPNGRRPLWLLQEPVSLSRGRQLPGRLTLNQGPERIESGWWDGARVRRDYYVARHEAGARYWVYRDLEDEGAWYLHGIFA